MTELTTNEAGEAAITTLPDRLRDEAVALWQDCGLTRPWNDPRADLDRALAGPSSTVLAALDATGGLLGTAMVGHDGHRAWVYYVAVDPTRRGSGLGRLLMDACDDWTRRQGIPKVQFMVRGDNSPVLAFYDRLGYEIQDVVVLGRRLD